MVTYDPNIPQPTDFPSDSQAQLLGNFSYLIPSSASTTGLSKDHFMTLGSTNTGDGTHRWVTFRANQPTPGFAQGVGVLYTNLANGQAQMYYNNGGGDIQMTIVKPISGLDAAIPSYAAGPPSKGVSFLPGGFLIQWGTSSTGNPTVFPVAFSVSPSVVMTPGGTLNNTLVPIVTLNGLTGFSVSSNVSSYFWHAIGLP